MTNERAGAEVIAFPAGVRVSWTDAASITSYLTSLTTAVLAVLAVLNPTWIGVGPAVQSIIGGVGLLVAGTAQLINIFTHRSSQLQHEAYLLGRHYGYGRHYE